MNVLQSLFVILMPCVQTHLGPSYVAAMKGTPEMEQLVQVVVFLLYATVQLPFFLQLNHL